MGRMFSTLPFLRVPAGRALGCLAAVLMCGVPSLGAPSPSDLSQPGLVPARLRCESADDPIGIDQPTPRLSWILQSSERARRQEAYEIQVASTPTLLSDGRPDLWSTGKIESSETAHVEYGGRPLPSSRPVYWRLRVWDDQGRVSAWSAPATWTTGLLSADDWHARWITSEFQPPAAPGLPLLRREFALLRPVRRALVHVCGLGHYELLIDGRKIGDRFLDPAWSVYERTAYYTTYDVTADLVKPGPHVFGLMLGKGFYNTAGDRRIHGVDARRPLQAILQAHLSYADGTEEILGTDAAWRTATGPITHSAILGGEDYDARRLPEGWAEPGFEDREWSPAIPCEGPGGRLRAASCPPMRCFETFAPRLVDEPEPGLFVYDFGQNASAIPQLRVRGPAGATVQLTPAEQRQGMTSRRNDGRGRVNPAGVGSPNFFRYTLRGDPRGESWTPRFTYTGFQYLQVEGAVPAGHPNAENRPVLEELVSLHVRNDAPLVGSFACSDPLLNDIDRIVTWAVRANLAHVLTDCPHREKLGWLEVSYLMGPSIAGRHDLSRFYAKVARDCSESQRADGLVPTVAPAYPAFSGGFAYTPEWGAAAVLNPWLLYEWYGDRSVLRENFATMKSFVAYLHKSASDLVPAPGLGDWYDYGHGRPVGPSQFTPVELSAMATFHRCARVVAEAARELGLADDERHHRELAVRIAAAFNARWFDGQAEYRNQGSPQTANSMALTEGIVPPDRTRAVVDRILEDLRQRGNQQTAGDIGHGYLIQALARAGHSDRLHTLATRTNVGSYGFIVRNGWTSMPEAWDADTGASMNHCMLGHIQEWFLGWVAGLRPAPDAPGFRQFLVDPQPVGNLTWARGSYDSIRGPIHVLWRRLGTGGRFLLELEVPPNTLARLRLPSTPGTTATEGGQPVEGRPGIRSMNRAGDRLEMEVAGGSYRFETTY
jgi:alpha-L-rhamnosidase